MAAEAAARAAEAWEMEEAGALMPDLEEKLMLGVTVIEGGGGGDIHAAGVRQGGPTVAA